MKTLFTALTLATLCGSIAMAATPEPSYSTTLKNPPFEVRTYTPQLAADVTLNGPEATTGKAFRILANYIFKEYPSGAIGMTAPVTLNTQAIGMTAPVTVKEELARVFMRFYLPERYTLATLPQPEDTRITIRQLPARKVAVVQFNGWLREAKIATETARLQAWVRAQNLTPTGAAEVQGYNPPWTLPWWRRNEIWLPL